jgi:hypothetical protein
MWARRHKGITYQLRKCIFPQVDKEIPIGFQMGNQTIDSSSRGPQREPSISSSPNLKFDIMG